VRLCLSWRREDPGQELRRAWPACMTRRPGPRNECLLARWPTYSSQDFRQPRRFPPHSCFSLSTRTLFRCMPRSIQPAVLARSSGGRRAASGERPVSRSTLSTKGDRPPILAAVVVEVAGYERLSSVFSRPPGRGRRFGSARRRTRGRQRTDWPHKTTLGSWPSKPCDVSGRWRINPHTRPSSQATAGEQGRTMAAEGSRTWRRG
jgi:hypothetical protein